MLENEDLVQVIEHISHILNLKTISNYAKYNKISYNDAKKRKNNFVVIDNTKYIINNL